MFELIRNYFSELTERFGAGWNRFWFTPSDARTLAVMRILTGLLATYTLLTFSFDLVPLFGPHGLVPSDTVREWVGNRYGFSHLHAVAEPAELWIVHLVGLAIVALFTIGLATRLTSVLAALVVLAYFHRAPMLTAEFEWILALLMVYLCLAPSGDRFSVDAWLRRRRQERLPAYDQAKIAPPPSPLTTIATRLIQVHLTVVYLSMGLSKLDGGLGDVWWGGTAMWWMLARPEQRIVDLTGLLHDHMYVINLWTHLTVLFELTFPILVWNRLARPLMLLIAAGMWILNLVGTGLVTFGLAMIVANLAFVSPSFWQLFVRPPAPEETTRHESRSQRGVVGESAGASAAG